MPVPNIRIKNIKTSAKKYKKSAYLIFEKKVDFGMFVDKKEKNIGIKYWLQLMFLQP